MRTRQYEIILFVTGKAIQVHMTKMFRSLNDARQYALKNYMFQQDDGEAWPKFSGLEVKRVA